MATESYPEGMPAPLLASLVRSGIVPIRSAKPVKGAPVIIKWTDDQTELWDIQWRLNPIELRAFDGWVYNNLNNCNEWFNIDLPISVDSKGLTRTVEANFRGSHPGSNTSGAFLVVTARIAVRDIFRE
jgi:hypothetical protein